MNEEKTSELGIHVTQDLKKNNNQQIYCEEPNTWKNQLECVPTKSEEMGQDTEILDIQTLSITLTRSRHSSSHWWCFNNASQVACDLVQAPRDIGGP